MRKATACLLRSRQTSGESRSRARSRNTANGGLRTAQRGTLRIRPTRKYERVLRVHLYPAFGSKRFSKITRKMVRELVAEKKTAGLSQSSIRNILAPLRGMYNQAIDDEDVHRNPAARMGKFNKKERGKPPINLLNREEDHR